MWQRKERIAVVNVNGVDLDWNEPRALRGQTSQGSWKCACVIAITTNKMFSMVGLSVHFPSHRHLTLCRSFHDQAYLLVIEVRGAHLYDHRWWGVGAPHTCCGQLMRACIIDLVLMGRMWSAPCQVWAEMIVITRGSGLQYKSYLIFV